LFAFLLVSAALAAGCGGSDSTVAAAPKPEPLAVAVATVESRPIDRYLRVTGSLAADEQAEVSAETAGRVIDTPVERGTRVASGALLVRISAAETGAQLQEAEANAAQIEARLGLVAGQPFDPTRVPDVMNARAAVEFAEAEFDRIKALLDQKVVSQSEYDQRRTQVEAARQQYQMAQNVAQQSYRSLEAARARVALARKSVADTSIRAPFSGLVSERAVSVGDYVTRGTRVATVVRVDPLRVELTVPEQAVSLVRVGQPVTLTVDAYPGEAFSATVRFVSPSVRPDQRALTVEAIARNADGRLKPGLFATASIQQPASAPALLVPASAIEAIAGTTRVYVVANGIVEERIVTLGDRAGDRVELTSGVAAGDVVVLEPKGRLSDGTPVQPRQ
jgi:RND family efflux transporter MFP subunit